MNHRNTWSDSQTSKSQERYNTRKQVSEEGFTTRAQTQHTQPQSQTGTGKLAKNRQAQTHWIERCYYSG